LLFILSSFGQNGEIENWRQLGYTAKIDKDFPAAIEYYQKILDADSADYDAKLALARLFVITEDYNTALLFFEGIYRDDSTDVEALIGMGECYSLKGDLEQAIEFYRDIMRIDDTYSEAWAGIGKMYYWMGKPKTSIVFYEKALELDPGNEDIKKEMQAVQSELDYALSVNFGPVNEREENYEINAMISKVSFEKRIDDHFHIQANFLLDYSNRDYTDNIGDTTRWYDNIWIKGSWISEHHTISLWSGYSNADNKLTSYGLNWKLNYTAGKVSMKNSLNAGYDYFYYWNKVGGKAVTDEALVSYGFIGLNARYIYGMIDPVTVYISDDSSGIHQNPYHSYGISLIFKIIKRPDIRIGLNYSYLNYEYKSPLYYSPFNRNLTGASASVYYDFFKFYVYGSFSYNIGTEYNLERDKDDKINVDNWSTNIELGYNFYPFSFSIGGSNFYNPYYQNITGFIAVKMLF
jgi:tetratricopeptide (TPR) repeat protein